MTVGLTMKWIAQCKVKSIPSNPKNSSRDLILLQYGLCVPSKLMVYLFPSQLMTISKNSLVHRQNLTLFFFLFLFPSPSTREDESPVPPLTSDLSCCCRTISPVVLFSQNTPNFFDSNSIHSSYMDMHKYHTNTIHFLLSPFQLYYATAPCTHGFKLYY